MSNDKTGAVRLFYPADASSPLHGWRGLKDNPLLGLVNPKGWACLHVIVQKLIGEGNTVVPRDLYDQVLIVENPGAVVVCQEGNKVGLVRSFRFTAERLHSLAHANKDYLLRIDGEDRWDELLQSLGRWQWELPRGLSPVSQEQDLQRFILDTARVEADEEAGFQIANARICGRVNPNSTFFTHAQYVVRGDIVRVGANSPEQLELIGKAQLFGKEELRRLAEGHEFDDGLSLAALALAGYAF